MIRAFLTLAALAALGAGVSAQIDNDSYWTDGAGNFAHVDVVDNPSGGVTVTVTDETGFTPATQGTEASTSTANDPAAKSFPATQTNSPNGNEYRGKADANDPKDKGHLERKNASGQWVKWRKTRKPKHHMGDDLGVVANPPPPPGRASVGDEGSSLPD